MMAGFWIGVVAGAALTVGTCGAAVLVATFSAVRAAAARQAATKDQQDGMMRAAHERLLAAAEEGVRQAARGGTGLN